MRRERALKVVLVVLGSLFSAGVLPVLAPYYTRISRCIPLI
jgi:hypothetical protein